MNTISVQNLKKRQLSQHISASSTSSDDDDGAGGAITTKKTVIIELSKANDRDDDDQNELDADDHDADDLPLEVKDPKKHKKADYIGYLKLAATASLDAVKKALAVADATTDIILLSAAAQGAADGEEGSTRQLMIWLFLSIMAPYILSYSSGIAMFLYRRTFNEMSALSFKSLLLTLYIFPTGCFYFIAIDICDALLSVYKLLAHIVLAKSAEEVLKAESSFVGYFGMSRMVSSAIYENI